MAGYGTNCDQEVDYISDWIESGKGYIQNGDWFNWFPNDYVNIGQAPGLIQLNDIDHPITEGLQDKDDGTILGSAYASWVNSDDD